jgi:dihydropteroate synthase
MKRNLEATVLKKNNQRFLWGSKTYVMGILNVTPDSFSDGGEFEPLNSALTQTQNMIKNGADIIDIGGQSTRPGAEQISLAEELKRVIPIIKVIREQATIPISIDTTRAEVARSAVEAGADIINDISGGTYDENMFSTAAQLAVPIILMHLKGTPQTMQSLTNYGDLITEIKAFLEQQINQAIAIGIPQSNIIIDPGIGFAKNTAQNIQLIQQLSQFKTLNAPILIGVSRKSFIGKITGQTNPKDRLWGTAAACCGAIANGADLIRVHDVAQMRDVAKVADTIWRS